MRLQKASGWAWALILSLGAAAACSEDPGDKKKDAASSGDAQDAEGLDAGDTAVEDTVDGGGDSSVNDVDNDQSGSTDAGSIDTGETVDAGSETSGSTDVVVGPECTTAADCEGKATPKACEQIACNAGKCGVALVPDKCCENAHCDDGQECTTDTCDVAKTSCLHTPVPNCCSGKTTLLKAGFEQGLGDLSAIEGPTNGNVKWQPSAQRVRVGNQALYLGNGCGTYDNTMKVDGNCEPGEGGTPISSLLQTKQLQLPKDKSTQLHFWLWLDTEPPYSTTLPTGTCSPACPSGLSCVSVNGASQCLPEKDVLTLSIIPDGAAAQKLFDSTQIGKTTAGDWQHVVLDLDAWQGKSVRLQWQFQTGTAFKNGYEGVYLDEVVLETVCPVAGTLCTASQACLDDGSVCTSDACTFYANAPNKGFCFHDASPGCCLVDANCNDGKPCTVDTCKSGACVYTPDGSKPSCCKPSVEWSEDFDSGVLDKWGMLGGNSVDVTWHIDPKAGTKGSQALVFADASGTSYADTALPSGTGPTGTACTPPVKLKIGTLYNLLSLQLNLETEWSYLPKGSYQNPPLGTGKKYDHFSIGVREEGVPGAKIEPLWSSDAIAGTTNGEWLELTLSLDAWQGKSVAVCFTFDAGDDQVNDRQGPRLDEVLVRVACTKPECLLDTDCDALSCPACEAPLCTDGACGCAKVAGCCQKATDCDDGDLCTADSCVSGTCQQSPIAACCKADTDCSSDDVCLAATCDLGSNSCTQTPVPNCCKQDSDCKSAKLCVTLSCDTTANQCQETPVQGCCTADKDCDDSDACTSDLCIDLKCTHTPSGAPGC